MGFLIRVLLLLMLSAAPLQAQTGVDQRIETLEFRDTSVGEAIRLIARISGVNIFATREAANRSFSLTVSDTTVRGVVASIARVSGLSYSFDESSNALMLMTNDQYANDVVITRNAETRIFNLQHQNVVTAAKVVESLFGDRVTLTVNTEDPDRLELSSEGLQSSRTVSGGGNSRSNKSGGDEEDFDISDVDPRRLQQLVGVDPNGKTINLSDVARRFGLEPNIYITINREHNLLYVRTADRDAMRDIAQIIKQSDRPTKQVLLEMRVMSLDLDDDARSSFNFGLSGSTEHTFNSVTGDSVTGPSGVAAGGFGRSESGLFFQFINDNLLAQLNALERQNKAKTLSTPMLAASNNSPARLFVGTEAVLARGFSSETTTGTTGATNTTTETEIELRDVGQTLQILPRINADDTVTLVVEQENSTVVQGGARVPIVDDNGDVTEIPVDTVNTARVGGTVTAKTGTTIAVGGLIRDSNTKGNAKTPVIGNIPILGLAFRGDTRKDERSELILLITPHIYSGGPEGERLARKRLSRISRNPDLDNEVLSASPDGTPPVKLRGQQQQFVPMTRFAAAMRHGLQPPETGAYRGFVEAPIQSGGGNTLAAGGAGGLKIFGNSGQAITAEAVESWQKRNLYVTAVVLTNTADGPQNVSVSNLRGSWLAATVEANTLTPRNQNGSRTYLYLISDRPYDDVIAELRAGGGL